MGGVCGCGKSLLFKNTILQISLNADIFGTQNQLITIIRCAQNLITSTKMANLVEK